MIPEDMAGEERLLRRPSQSKEAVLESERQHQQWYRVMFTPG